MKAYFSPFLFPLKKCMRTCSTRKMVPSTETFTAQQLKEARQEFNNLKKLMETCQSLSKDIEAGKCDFNSILACLYAIEKNPMYKFLAERDSVLKQTIDVTFLRLRNVGGIMMMSNQHQEMNEKEKEEVKELDVKMKELDDLIKTRNINEPDLKRKLEEIIEEEDEEKEKPL